MMFRERLRIKGEVTAELRSADGSLKSRVVVPNLITTVGEQNYAAGYASLTGTTGLTAPQPVYGMQLGTSNAAVGAAGTGAAINAYISGSTQPITTGWPQVVTIGAASAVRWKTVWEAGEGTSATIREVTMVTNSSDAPASQADTVARALFTTVLDKWATDTLTIVWIHSFTAA